MRMMHAIIADVVLQIVDQHTRASTQAAATPREWVSKLRVPSTRVSGCRGFAFCFGGRRGCNPCECTDLWAVKDPIVEQSQTKDVAA